ncbi:TIGR00266 family protein [candidate division WOR-3 bacterium]|nr:TIGR00266 family protein [candidate division WOR-3 bacterium]
MKYEILYQPSYSVAKVFLDKDESLTGEAGAMVAMTPNIELKSEMGGGKSGFGGFMKAAARSFVGESFFQAKYTALNSPGEIILAPSGVGDVTVIELQNQSYMVQSGSYLASSSSLIIDTKFTGGKSFFSREGLFMIKVTGTGTLFVSSFGAIHQVEIPSGQEYIVDNGHIVAFDATVQYKIEKAAKGFISSVTSGEGFVCRYQGPGKIYLQTRQVEGLANLIIPYVPKK